MNDAEKVCEPELHRAVRIGDHLAIRELCEAGAELSETARVELTQCYPAPLATPLMVAAGSREGATVETLRLLIELGADPTQIVDGRSAAFFACTGSDVAESPGGDVARLQILLDAGSPIDLTGEYGGQALCHAAERGDVQLLRLLLDHGANPDGFFDPEEARPKFLDIYQELEEMIVDEQERKTSAPWSYQIPLFMAVASGSIECITLLLNRGANANIRDACNETAMWHANNNETIQLLIDQGLKLEDRNWLDWTPLQDAVNDGLDSIPRIKALIAIGANVNDTHDHGFTLFMGAVGSMERNRRVLEVLVEAGADPHAVSDYGHNAFHAAIDVGDVEANKEECVRSILSYLVELGVNIEQRNKSDKTPLALAISEGTSTEVRVLSEIGADVNAVGPRHIWVNDQWKLVSAPLVFAAISEFIDPADKLEAMIHANVRLVVVDENGFSPIEHARSLLSNLETEKQSKSKQESVCEIKGCIELLEDALNQNSS